MKTGRLKALNKQIEDMFAEPLTHHRWAGIKESGGMEYIRCGLCEQVRRENYRLKQQAMQMEERKEEQVQIRREMQALKELYQLKCREADLLRERLQQAERQVEAGQLWRQSFRREGVEYFQSLLRK